MKENVKQFSIDDIQEVATDESVEFAIARIAALSTRPNSHKVNITEEILRRDGISVRGKWIIAEYDKWKGDVTTHTHNTNIVGIVPQDAKIDFVTTDDGYVVMYVDAIISKLYATDFYRMFRDGVNRRAVSVEMATSNDYELPDGSTDIDGLNIYSICVLGQKINGSCPDANMKITKFSEKEANEFYNKAFALNKIKDMANDLIQFADNQLKLKELENTSKGEYMEENKDFSEQPKEEDIVMEEEKQEESKTNDTKEMEEDSKDSEENIEKKELGCGEKKMEEQPKEKTFAEQCIECADEDNKEFISKLFSCEVKDIVSKIVELKKFNEQTIKEKTEKRFSEIMVEPKLCLGEKAYNVLFEEGKTLTFEELDNFETKVKAFCEDAPKKQEKNEDELLKFASSDTNDKQEYSDVWSRIANS